MAARSQPARTCCEFHQKSACKFLDFGERTRFAEGHRFTDRKPMRGKTRVSSTRRRSSVIQQALPISNRSQCSQTEVSAGRTRILKICDLRLPPEIKP
jgi:hypothetical protein